ncbi:MAG TPA: TIR domain-containing protein [Actinospica sp.]|nr:TIR domain-containing protein [Actinospica sp.]
MSGGTFGNASIGGNGIINQGGDNVHQSFNAPERPDVAAAEQSRRQSLLEEAVREQQELTRSVFVVYGRDDAANSAVFQLLRRLDLKPLEWESLVRGSRGGMTPMLGDVVINAPRLASGAVVVLTPDDMVMLHPELRKPREDPFEQHPSLQPRPNVLLELGLVLGVYPERTLILEFGERRPIADLNGLNSIRFHQHTDYVDALRKIAGRLQEAGLPVDDAGSDWLDPRPFENLKAYRRRPH